MSDLDENEIIQSIKHSDLPTVLVEGKTDIIVYRKLELFLGTTKANFFPCGGRARLLAVFRRRAEFHDKRVCFVADKDMRIFTNIPHDWSEIIFSEGYSIENDIYSDSDIEKLLAEDDKPNHKTIIYELARWFAGEVEKFLSNQQAISNPGLDLLIPINTFTCCPKHLAKIGFLEPQKSTREDLETHYKMKFRGKLLYEVLLRFIKEISTVNKLIEESLDRCQDGVLLQKILKSVRERLGIPPSGEQMSLQIG